MTTVFGRAHEPEQVVFGSDPDTGLRVIVAIHSTALGPALGGTRCYPYPDEDTALADVLRLAEAMAYKSALAGLPLGGGKAVIIGDPAAVKSDGLLRAYGRFLNKLGGRYITACDVGTESADMDVIARESRFVTGRTTGAGDSAVLTAYGVLLGMRAAAGELWGSTELAGRRVAVEGVGKVGARLVDHLVEQGASVVVFDVAEHAVADVVARHATVQVAANRADLLDREPDIYAPCALGGVVTTALASTLRAGLVCGAANNQLGDADAAAVLADRGIGYAPDYLVNAGGLIQVADEIDGFDFDRAKRRTEGIFRTTREVFRTAAADGVSPLVVAARLAEQRMVTGVPADLSDLGVLTAG
ncbi:MAG TPA: Glu/Leu/Phe/Val dehydrogenase dimerization domain-containing protein [Pseudonocardiaceae bacterium]|nr:Glu/Leu/Phe/Val dehydrogenase dimerization domain-containing protein [Pseudonocardiaceae bacterium]